MGDQSEPLDQIDATVDVAQYLAWSRTWAAAERRLPVEPEVVEQRMVRFFHELCQRIAPDVVVEIGAHEAGFSRWAAEAIPDARVTAYEANPHVHEKYAEILAATRVEYLNLCVGPVNGEVDLFLPTGIRGREMGLASRMASLKAHTLAADQTKVRVPSVRLEDHQSLAPDDRVVAWVDVEGATQVVLESSESVLAHVRALYVEVENKTMWEGQWLDTDVAGFLRSHGMVPVARDIATRRHRYNVVFVRIEEACDLWTARMAAKVLQHRRARKPESSTDGPDD
jgi:FkbM family methyltransferase